MEPWDKDDELNGNSDPEAVYSEGFLESLWYSEISLWIYADNGEANRILWPGASAQSVPDLCLEVEQPSLRTADTCLYQTELVTCSHS